ncbi:MAG: cystathionine gamma-synthase [Planctomycetota bacterium]
MTNDYKIETLAVHAGQKPDPATGAVTVPIYQTSTFVQHGVSRTDNKGYIYSRPGNPTRTALETNLAALEGAKHSLAFASGMAAIDAVMRLLHPDDHMVVGKDVYGGTFRLIDNVLKPTGLGVTFVDLTDLDAFREGIRANTKLVWLETPTNPTLKLVDIATLSEIAHTQNILVAVDNTFASPYLQHPLALGADIVVHSATKYLGGHSDLVSGAVMLNDTEIYEKLAMLQFAAGAIPGPQDCWLLLRGIKTLPLRMERHCQNAMILVHWLAEHPAVERVNYPGLPDHPQHKLAKRQMSDFGGMISIVLKGGAPAAEQMVKKTKLFTLAVSLGGVESLIEVPAGMTHASMVDSDIAVDQALVRISVGIEHVGDLQADLATALTDL